MQQLIGDKDGFNQRPQDSKPLEAPKPVVITQVAPTCCLVFSNMFDQSQVDLRKDPAFFIDIKD